MAQALSVDSLKVRRILKDRFGIRSLRPGQGDVINSVLKGDHTLALMPTGAGKSLCFQLPALVLPGTTLVVTPLIALMKDQTEKLDQLQIEALELSSTLKDSEQNENVELAQKGKTEFLYVTPERLTSAEFLESMKKVKIDLLVIDEAHCISQWGHDFRPAYLVIPDAWKKLGKPQILALTATATNEVVEDIKKQLALPDLKLFSSGILRNNLHFESHLLDKESDKMQKVQELLKNLEGNGIIYCATVKSAEALHDFLNEQGLPADLYHGKLSAKDRSENRIRFMESQDRIMVATNAFGMGIDKPDIRFVIHFQFPGSLEAYYQEAGRAGRDGLHSRCILLYLKKDKSTQSFFLAGKYPSLEDTKKVYQQMQKLFLEKQIFSQEELMGSLDVPASKIKVLLALFKSKKIVQSLKSGLKLKSVSLTEAQISQLSQDYLVKKEADADKLKQMIIYAQSALCRWKILLQYFDQTADWESCQHCDNCAKKSGVSTLSVQPSYVPQKVL